MSNLFDYNITPGSNNAAAPVGAPENMLPSSVNDTMRQMMANSAAAFTCYTAGGSANAQTVTMSPTLAAYSNKVRIAFIPVASNTGACTLNVNSLGAVDIKMLDGTDPPAGALNSSGVSIVQHNGTNFRLLNPVAVLSEQTLTLDVTFTSGTAKLISQKTNSGKLVTVLLPASANHTSSSSPVTSELIPVGYRPPSSTARNNVGDTTTNKWIEIASTGTIRVQYSSAQTATNLAMSVTYYVPD